MGIYSTKSISSDLNSTSKDCLSLSKSYSDTNIVRQLVGEGHGLISARRVARIKKCMDFVRRMKAWERACADRQSIEQVRKELDEGQIEGYGQALLETWFRKQGIVTTR